MLPITIEPVKTPGQLRKFIDFPHDLYAGEPAYVPELYMAQEELLNPRKSPFFQHSTAEYWLAFTPDGRLAGRIAAICNNNYIAFTGEKAGFFGFFEVVNNAAVAHALLDTAAAWLREKGLNRMIGPTNFSTNETCGLLIENFSEPPYILTTWNYPYYAGLLEQYGMVKHTDLISYEMREEALSPKLEQVADQLEERLHNRGFTIRTLRMKHFHEEVEKFLHLYNASWDQNLGFVPMTEAEVRQMGKDLKMAVDPDLVMFAEKDGVPVGMALVIPNLNEIFQKIPRGRLFPTGIFKLLLGRKSIRTVRVVALGILPEYRRTGIDMCFYVRIYRTCRRKGYRRGEASWILENNDLMNRALLQIAGRPYRKHRIYEKMVKT